jgi:hypothetical protein
VRPRANLEDVKRRGVSSDLRKTTKGSSIERMRNERKNTKAEAHDRQVTK